MSESTHQPDAVTEVARDLTAIEELVTTLSEQAVNDANDRSIPGGDALVARAPVASPEAWEHRFEHAERHGHDTSHARDHDEDDEPPLQTLLFWSEQWRAEHGMEFEPEPHRPYPTVATEANFIRWCLPWAWDNEPHFEDFARDMRGVVAKLEAILTAGRRNQRGVQCFDCGTELVRQSWDPRTIHHCTGHEGVCFLPHDVCPHDRGGLRDEWLCPGCDRRYSMEDYARAVGHAHYAFANYLTLDDAAARTDVKAGTIKVWATRGKVRKKRDRDSGRMTYCVRDIEACDTGTEGVAS